MRIKLNSVLVEDQARAVVFYTDVLGFKKSKDIPVGELRWITVSPEGQAVIWQCRVGPRVEPSGGLRPAGDENASPRPRCPLSRRKTSRLVLAIDVPRARRCTVRCACDSTHSVKNQDVTSMRGSSEGTFVQGTDPKEGVDFSLVGGK